MAVMTNQAAPMGQTRNYPVAADMPEIQQDKRIQDGGSPADGAANPVVDALKVLTQFVLAAEAKGLPQAAKMKTALGGFISAVSSGGAGGGTAPKAGSDMPSGATGQPPEAEAAQEGESVPAQTAEASAPGGEQPTETAEPSMPGQPPTMPRKKMPMPPRRSSQPDQITPLA